MASAALAMPICGFLAYFTNNALKDQLSTYGLGEPGRRLQLDAGLAGSVHRSWLLLRRPHRPAHLGAKGIQLRYRIFN